MCRDGTNPEDHAFDGSVAGCGSLGRESYSEGARASPGAVEAGEICMGVEGRTQCSYRYEKLVPVQGGMFPPRLEGRCSPLPHLAARVARAKRLEVVDLGCDFVHPGYYAQPVVG
jgi:hypothetical protein